jgi:glycosyltransferase involved in cell wall biosynthesis
MPTLSVILITRNEEANLRDCLASLGGLAQQVVIVDTASTDGTIAIAQEFGATIAQPADWPGFGPQKNRALDLATGDWVLSLDADERLTPALQAEIAGVLEKPGNATCFAIPRLSWYCGRFIRHSGWNPDYVDRLFQRGTARFSDDLVHERLIPSGSVVKLKNHMLHYSFMNYSQVLQKIDRYSSASAEQAFAKGKQSSPLAAIGHGAWSFFRTYFIRLGFFGWAPRLRLSHLECTRYLLSLYQALATEPRGAQGKSKLFEKSPMISVLLATYNWPEALQKCLESLANQTDTDFEIIIADDGSGPFNAIPD